MKTLKEELALVSNMNNKEEIKEFKQEENGEYKGNLNNFSYWFPLVAKKCGKEFKIPMTLTFNAPGEIQKMFYFDNPDEDVEGIREWVKESIYPNIPEEMYFLFVKNGTYSDKFNGSCYVRRDINELANAIGDINYEALCVGAVGDGGMEELVIRENVWGPDWRQRPRIYNNMPLTPEFRVFYDFDVRKVLYVCNYWDWDYCNEAICANANDKIIYEHLYPSLLKFYEENKEYVAENVGQFMKNVELKGRWSVDIMYANNKFWFIDMAEAERSAYYDPERCK